MRFWEDTERIDKIRLESYYLPVVENPDLSDPYQRFLIERGAYPYELIEVSTKNIVCRGQLLAVLDFLGTSLNEFKCMGIPEAHDENQSFMLGKGLDPSTREPVWHYELRPAPPTAEEQYEIDKAENLITQAYGG